MLANRTITVLEYIDIEKKEELDLRKGLTRIGCLVTDRRVDGRRCYLTISGPLDTAEQRVIDLAVALELARK